MTTVKTAGLRLRAAAAAAAAASLLLGGIAATPRAARAQAAPAVAAPASPTARENPVTVAATAAPAEAHPGEIVTVTVRATVKPGWHLYAPTTAAPPNAPSVPSDITAFGDWEPVGPTRVAGPAPEKHRDPAFDADVAYYEGEAVLARDFRVPAAAPAAAPAASFHYQVCDASVCLPPTTVSAAPALTVTAGAARPEFSKASAAPAPAPAGEAPAGWGGFLLAALGGGLLALVTPCVFPLIPITLAGFAKQANGDRRKAARLATGYALGVIALYVAVGAVASAVLGAAGANQLGTNPWVNLFAFAVFVVFALSFFESIQLQLPGGMAGALQQLARAKGGWVGLALLGVVFVLASFTCTAPFIGTLLVASAGGERIRPLVGMAVFALAFTSPFLFFGAFPQLISKLPKSGSWLARVKATLGFVELAAALKFLSNVDLAWQWKLLTAAVLLAAWALLFVCAALYLLGLLRFGVTAEDDPATDRVTPGRRIFAGLFTAAAIYCFWGLTGRPISPWVAAFLPPEGYGASAASAASATTDAVPTGPHDVAGLEWLSDYDDALAQAKAAGKPLLVDFTGVYCVNCRLNEKNVFPQPAAKEEMARFVRVQLYVDSGPDAAKNMSLEEKTFGDVAQPLYGIVDPATGAVAAKTAGVQTTDGFTAFLKDGFAKVPSAAPAVAEAAPAASGETAKAWAPLTDEALAAAKAAGKPVVIDFTAAWCVNCHAIEREVFENAAVAPRLAEETVTLRCDMTRWTDPANVALQKKYGIAALPTVILLNSKGDEAKTLRITGRLPVADFQKRLDTLKAS